MSLAALESRAHWIVYKLIRRPDGRTDKVPTDPKSLRPIDAHDRTHWMRGDVALGLANLLGAEYGRGIVLYAGCDLVGLDIDKAWNGAEWSPVAQELCGRLAGAYQEISPSGTGLRILFSVTGDVPPHRNKNLPLHVEMYSDVRFLTITGASARGDPLFDGTALLPQLIADYFEPPAVVSLPEWTDEPHPDWRGPEDDAELLARMRNSRSPRSIFGDDVTMADILDANALKLGQQWPSSTGQAYDASSVDQSAANRLAWWTGGNCERIERIMRALPLARAKWDDRPEYLRETILKAVAWQQGKGYYKGASGGVPPVPEPPAAVLTTPEGAIPPAPSEAPKAAPPAIGRGDVVTLPGQLILFKNFTYVQDIHRISTPNGLLLDSGRFDVAFGGREFVIRKDGGATTSSAWEAITQSQVYDWPHVRATEFDPLSEPQTIRERDGLTYLNVWTPLRIYSEPGDPTFFINHLRILFPDDWHILLNYLKFMVQHKGRKAKWWPFLQGVPGNGKSFISDTMEYCIGQRYTQRPTPKNIDSQFNSSLYACLFIALEDVKVKEDHGALWETLKPMVTQSRIEIQPKGVDKVTREVCFNGILNSNHKDGIRKDRDDRRIAPFFAAQQYKADLERDGLTPEYFDELWRWARCGGWARVAHYLATDPIDEEWNPATRCQIAPVTSSTEEAIRIGLGFAEQEVLEAVKAQIPGFCGGWINGKSFEILLKGIGRRLTPSKRHDILISLGYEPHPALRPSGHIPIPLSDGTRPALYVANDHMASGIADPAIIKRLYEAAQRG